MQGVSSLFSPHIISEVTASQLQNYAELQGHTWTQIMDILLCQENVCWIITSGRLLCSAYGLEHGSVQEKQLILLPYMQPIWLKS